MTKERIDATIGGLCRGGAARAEGRLRLRRDPRRARLPDLAIPRAVREPPHRRIRRLARKPRPLRARRAARGEGRGARLGVIYRLSVEDFFDGGLTVRARAGGSRSGRRRPAPTRCTSPPGTTARMPSARSHDPADGRAGRAVPRIRRRREAGGRRAGDRGRPARRSRDRDRGGRRAARPISSRSAARWSPIRNGSRSCAAASRSGAASPATPASTACAAAPASAAWSTAPPAARRCSPTPRRRATSASR